MEISYINIEFPYETQNIWKIHMKNNCKKNVFNFYTLKCCETYTSRTVRVKWASWFEIGLHVQRSQVRCCDELQFFASKIMALATYE